VHRKNFCAPFCIGKDVDLELNYWDIDNTKKLSVQMLKLWLQKIWIGFLVGENDGQGILLQRRYNRDFAAARVFVKY
jgi:hypothetical protein